MGGNAIKKDGVSICSRLKREQYEVVKQKVLAVLSSHFQCEVVLELAGKEDFGDIDVLYVANDDVNVVNMIKQEFAVVDEAHIVEHGYVVSFAFDCACAGLAGTFFQVDLIQTSDIEHFRAARFYFSYGDLGFILGRIFSNHGITFGDTGLWCEVTEGIADPSTDSNIKIGKVVLSHSPADICAFAGLDYGTWANDFPKITDKQELSKIFLWIATSRFFKPTYFAVDIGNSAVRIRQQRRPFYERFVAFAEELRARQPADAAAQHLNPAAAVREALLHFGRTADATALVAAARSQRARRAKFSGSDVIAGYQAARGCKLGWVDMGVKVNAFKAFCLGEAGAAADGDCRAWEAYVDAHSRETLLARLDEFVRADTDGGAD